MPLTSCDRLGRYEIGASLGAGGKGEVYRARDTRLEHDVAIKILPAEFSENAQQKLRFERLVQNFDVVLREAEEKHD